MQFSSLFGQLVSVHFARQGVLSPAQSTDGDERHGSESEYCCRLVDNVPNWA